MHVGIAQMAQIGGFHVGVEPKNRGKPPKMDGEHNGKPLLKWMIWGKTHYFWKHSCYFMGI